MKTPVTPFEPALLTADEVASDPRYRDCELWDGIPVVKEPSGGFASFSAVQAVWRLAAHVHAGRLGWVGGADVGFLLRRDPDRLLSPDGAYVSRERLSLPPPRGFAEVVPDFVLEVRSPSQSWREVVEKCLLWREHGVAVVWAVDPLAERCYVMRPGAPPVLVPRGSRLQASPVLPGFSVLVDDLFPPPT
jgi:Uma2 family endonuclease